MALPEEDESAGSVLRRAWRQAWRQGGGADDDLEEQLPPAPKPESGWPAVQRLWRHLLGSGLTSGEQVPEIPGEITQGWKAVLAAFGLGALIGGGKQWEEERKQAMKALLTPRPMAHRHLTPKVFCMLRMSDAVLRSGLASAGLVSLGLGVHALCVVYRGSRVWGIDGAAAAAAATAVAAVHHLSRSPRTWPLPQPVVDRLQFATAAIFISSLVLDELYGLNASEEERKAREEAKKAAAEAEKQRRAEAVAAQRERDVAAELLAQLEAAQRGKGASDGAAAAAAAAEEAAAARSLREAAEADGLPQCKQPG